MLPTGGKTWLLALVACAQLVLGPALRAPVTCGSDPGVAHPCCAAPAAVEDVPAAGAGCCCGHDEQPAPAPRDESPSRRCACHHGPQPWAPADDAAMPIGDAGAKVAFGDGGAVVVPPEPLWHPAPFGARAGPPVRAGPALHVLHCVFLI